MAGGPRRPRKYPAATAAKKRLAAGAIATGKPSDVEMTTTKTGEELELIRGSGNVFRDFGDANPDLEQAKAILAARIIGILDERSLTTRKAASLTGFQQADFARLRKVKTGRFTVDRLIKIINALDDSVEGRSQ